jgi:hypothetical protein
MTVLVAKELTRMTNRCEESELSKVSPVPRLPKLYSTPTLTVFGAVARLTKGYGGPLHDTNGTARKLP